MDEVDEITNLLWENEGNVLTPELIEALLRLIYERTGDDQ